MPKPRVYVETTIPSAYHTDRSDPVMVDRTRITRAWWSSAAQDCELVTSFAVLEELARGSSGHVVARLALLEGMRLLEVTPAVIETADTYVAHRIMPSPPSDDALHLALASHYTCDVLITWNYRHLANAGKFDYLRRINARRGLAMPLITVPPHPNSRQP